MWIKAGIRYFNTDAIAYAQVAYGEDKQTVKALYLYFLNQSHTFTLHGTEATMFIEELDAHASNGKGQVVHFAHAA